MLVLGRHINEAIVIGGHITIRVVGVTPGGLVRLGIDAPKEVTVHREEIQRVIARDGERRSREED